MTGSTGPSNATGSSGSTFDTLTLPTARASSSFMMDSILGMSSGNKIGILESQKPVAPKTPERSQGSEGQEEDVLMEQENPQALEQDSEGQDLEIEVEEEEEEEEEDDPKRIQKNFEWFGKNYDYTGLCGLDVLADCVHQMDLGVPEVEVPSGYMLHLMQHTNPRVSARTTWHKLPQRQKDVWNAKSREQMMDEAFELGEVRKVPIGGKSKKKKLLKGKYMKI